MYEKHRMAGPWIPLPCEVIFELEKVTASAAMLYISILAHFYVEENWQTKGEWVEGIVTASKREIVRRCNTHMVSLWEERPLWRSLLGAGLIKETETGLSFPKFKKKEHDYFSIQEFRDMRAMLNEMADAISLLAEGDASGAVSQIEGAIASRDRNDRELRDRIDRVTRSPESDLSLLGPREREMEEEDRASKDLAVVDNSPGTADWIRELIINLWPSRGYRQEDEGFVAKYAGGDPEQILEAFTAAKSQKVKRLSWLENRLDDPDVYKGAANGREEGQGQGTGADFRSGKNDKRPGTGTARRNKGGVGRVDIEEWPEVE